MKNFILLAVFCGFISYSVQDDKEYAEKMQSSKDACVKEIGIDGNVAEKALQGEFGDDKNLKCFIKCIFLKLGHINEDGSINEEFMKKHPQPGVDPAKHLEIVDKCKTQTGSDICERVFNMAKCARDAMKA